MSHSSHPTTCPLAWCAVGKGTVINVHSSLAEGRPLLHAGFLCALVYGALLCALCCALPADHLLLGALPCAALAAAAYFGAMNAAVAHAVLPRTSPLARAAPGTATALARQIVRCPPSGVLCHSQHMHLAATRVG